jgi:hypothetical protein
MDLVAFHLGEDVLRSRTTVSVKGSGTAKMNGHGRPTNTVVRICVAAVRGPEFLSHLRLGGMALREVIARVLVKNV